MRCEALLRQAELWAGRWRPCAASASGPPSGPRGLGAVLLHQFHDILPGSAIAWVHREAREDFDRLTDELEALVGGGARRARRWTAQRGAVRPPRGRRRRRLTAPRPRPPRCRSDRAGAIEPSPTGDGGRDSPWPTGSSPCGSPRTAGSTASWTTGRRGDRALRVGRDVLPRGQRAGPSCACTRTSRRSGTPGTSTGRTPAPGPRPSPCRVEVVEAGPLRAVVEARTSGGRLDG